jgi:hypothetical protein
MEIQKFEECTRDHETWLESGLLISREINFLMINNHYFSLERWSMCKVGIPRWKMNIPKAYDAS